MSQAQKTAVWLQRRERSNMPMLRLMSWISLRMGRSVARSVLSLVALLAEMFVRQ